MRKEKILEDETLEALNLIKEIDTLSIVNQAYIENEKKKLFLRSLFVLFLALIILVTNFILFIKVGLISFFAIEISLSWVIIILFIPLLKKSIKGV